MKFRDNSVFSDIVMNSATKFISGHADLMAGVLTIKGERCFWLFLDYEQCLLACKLVLQLLSLRFAFRHGVGWLAWRKSCISFRTQRVQG